MGLAHPLRVRLCDELTVHGAATATQLAERLGESSGATSYHLRQLAKYGFVEEVADRGTARERWWRRVPGGITIDGPDLIESPATRDATRLVIDEFTRAHQARADHWRATYADWPRAWSDASLDASSHLRLRPEELRQLNEEVDAVVTAWTERARDRQDDDLVDVEVRYYSFPVGPPPTDGQVSDAAR